MSIFSKYKDSLLDRVEDRHSRTDLQFPLQKIGGVINNYARGDFIVVGGRKTSGKAAFVMSNYIIGPILQKLYAKRDGKNVNIKLMYFSTKDTLKSTIDKMIVSYISATASGSKVSIPSLYSYRGARVSLSEKGAKAAINNAMTVFDKFSTKGFLSVIPGQKSISEIESMIELAMLEYGEVDEETGIFTYAEEYKDLTTIITINSAAGVLGKDGVNALKNDVGQQLGSRLRTLAKKFNILVVLTVPSSKLFGLKRAVHESSSEEVAPFDIFCDRCLILHNPAETDESSMLGYELEHFTETASGINYLRTVYVASNHMGPSCIYYGVFMYPENGYMVQLPQAEDEQLLEDFYERVTPLAKTVVIPHEDTEE